MLDKQIAAPEPEVDREDAKVTMVVAGQISAAGIRSGRLFWICDMTPPNVWWREVPLPHGINARDVAALHASPNGITLIVRRGDMYCWGSQAETWRRGGTLFSRPEGAR